VTQVLINRTMRFVLKFFGILTEVKKPLKTIPRFAFVGEFGYSYFGYLPFLNFLATEKQIPIRTIGTKGSSPFYYFSKDHLELNIEPTGSWGSFKGALKLLKYASRRDPIFVPLSFTSREINLGKDIPRWESRSLHVYHENYSAYRELRLPKIDLGLRNLRIPTSKKYFVINVKNYQSWDNQYIPNWYTKADLREIGDLASKIGYDVILNQSPVSASRDEVTYENKFVEEFRADYQAIDLSPYYSTLSTSVATEFQIEILRNAEHVWAVQGGNALLAMSLAKSCSVLMRGGADWIDYEYFRKLYSAQSEIIYEVSQSRLLKL